MNNQQRMPGIEEARAQTAAIIAGQVLPALAAEHCRQAQERAACTEGPGYASTVRIAFEFGEVYAKELDRRAVAALALDNPDPSAAHSETKSG